MPRVRVPCFGACLAKVDSARMVAIKDDGTVLSSFKQHPAERMRHLRLVRMMQEDASTNTLMCQSVCSRERDVREGDLIPRL